MLRTVVKGGEESLEKVPATLDDLKRTASSGRRRKKAAGIPITDPESMKILKDSEMLLWGQQSDAIKEAFSYWNKGNPIPQSVKDNLTSLGLPLKPKDLNKIREVLPAGMEYIERGEYVEKFLPMLRQQEEELLALEAAPFQSAWTMNQTVDLEFKRQAAIEQASEFWNTGQPLPADVEAELRNLGLPTDQKTMARWQETPRPELPTGNRPELAAYNPVINDARPDARTGPSMTVRDAERELRLMEGRLGDITDETRRSTAWDTLDRRTSQIADNARRRANELFPVNEEGLERARKARQEFTDRLSAMQQTGNLAGAPMALLGGGLLGYDDGNENTERPLWQTALGAGLLAGGALLFGMTRSPRRVTFDDAEKGTKAVGHINLPFADTKPSVLAKGLNINMLDDTRIYEVMQVGEDESKQVYRVVYEHPLGGFAEDYVTDIPDNLASGVQLKEGQTIGTQWASGKNIPPEWAGKSAYDVPAAAAPGPSVGRKGSYNGQPVTIVEDNTEKGFRTPYKVRTADGRNVVVRYDEIAWEGEPPPVPQVREAVQVANAGAPVMAEAPPPIPGTMSAEEFRRMQADQAAESAATGAEPPPPVDDFEAQKAAAFAEFQAKDAAFKAEQAAREAAERAAGEAQQRTAEADAAAEAAATGAAPATAPAAPAAPAAASRIGTTGQWRDPDTGQVTPVNVLQERDPSKGLPYQVQDPKSKRKFWIGEDEVTWPQLEAPATPAAAPAAPPVRPRQHRRCRPRRGTGPAGGHAADGRNPPPVSGHRSAGAPKRPGRYLS